MPDVLIRPAADAGTSTATVVQRAERWTLLLALLLCSGIAWFGLLRFADRMSAMPAMSAMPDMPGMAATTSSGPWFLFVMWAVMMVAMMLPSASPFILLFASIQRARRVQQAPAVNTALLVAGYLIAWTVFAAVASVVQTLLQTRSLVSAAMVSTSTLISACILIGAGIYQWLPVKELCLKACRSPLGFLATEWRDGRRGAVVMGLRHGVFCIGCCWPLMALLFVVGVMSLVWIAVISLLVLVEKLAPRGFAIARAGGVVLACAGFWLLATS
jgi:predicted metal-binding membrane protein